VLQVGVPLFCSSFLTLDEKKNPSPFFGAGLLYESAINNVYICLERFALGQESFLSPPPFFDNTGSDLAAAAVSQSMTSVAETELSENQTEWKTVFQLVLSSICGRRT